MAKKTFKGALYLYTAPLADPKNPYYHFDMNTKMDGDSFTKVVEHEFEIEIPADFDPVPRQIADLTEKKRLLRLKLAQELADLDDRISKLSALTFEAA